ncbi:hypothetical protein [Rubrivivax sp. A210]|uniref:hypothetical protein n=1 Tax=Rubrivivax sp. A210 TaxID=2772301 RepID=UPI001917CC67|nr:hypothetical protein [Rubrivivax sp. A210]
MDQNVQALAQFFEESWQPMLALMARARAIEFRIRLAAEVHAQATFSNSRNWEEFQKGSRRVVRQKLERHVKALFPASADQMILIRQCADGLAHADYRAARLRIDQYGQQFPLSSPRSKDDVGVMLYKNITHPDGSAGDLAYLLNTSDDNLILEEYEVFAKQGYVVAAEELLALAEQQLGAIAPRLNLKYAALVMSRGLKYGKRVDG